MRRSWAALAVAAATVAAVGVLPAAASTVEPIDTWPITQGIDCEKERFNPLRANGTRNPLGDPKPGTKEWDQQQKERVACGTQRNEDRRYHPPFVQAWSVGSYGQDWYREPVRLDDVRFRYDYFPAERLAAAGLGIPGVAAAEIFRPCAPGQCGNLPAELERFTAPYPVAVIFHGATAQMKHHRFTAQMLAEQGYLTVVLNGAPVGGAPTFPDGKMGPAVLDWLASDGSGEFGREADLSRIGFAGHSAGAAAALTSQGDPRLDAIVAWDSNSAGDAITDDNCLKGKPCAPIMYLRADGAFSAPQNSTRSGYPENRDWGLVPYLKHRQRGMDVFHVTFRATNHIDFNGNGIGGLAGNRFAESAINYYTLAWFDRHVKGALVADKAGRVVRQAGRSEAQERAHRQQVVTRAYERLIAHRFDDSADRHNISMGFWDPVRAATSGDVLYGGNTPYTIAGLPTTDRLATDFRSYCAVSLPNYTSAARRGLLARADSGAARGAGPANDMRIHGCREVFRHPNGGR